MIKLSFIAISIILLLSWSCTNDYRIKKDRAGTFKVGMSAESFRTKMIQFKREKFQSNNVDSYSGEIEKFYLNNQLIFSSLIENDKLLGLRIYSKEYLTEQYLQVGTPTSTIIEHHQIMMAELKSEKEYFCKAYQKNSQGKVDTDEYVNIVLSGKPYKDGNSLSPSGNSDIKCFVIGEYFLDDFAQDEDKIFGYIENNLYFNPQLKLYIPLNNDWEGNDEKNKSSNQFFCYTFKHQLKNLKVRFSYLKLSPEERGEIKNGKQYLEKNHISCSGQIKNHSDIYISPSLKMKNDLKKIETRTAQLRDEFILQFIIESEDETGIESAIDFIEGIYFK